MIPQPAVKHVTLIFACLAMLAIFFNQATYNTVSLAFLLFAVGLFISYKSVLQAVVQPYRGFFVLLMVYFILYQVVNLYHLGLEDYWYAFKRSRWVLYAAFFVPLGIFLFREGISGFYRRTGVYLYLFCLLLAGLIFYDSFTRLAFDEASTALWWKTSHNHLEGSRVSWTYNPIPFSQLAFFAALVFYAIFYCAEHRGLRYSALSVCVGMLAVVIFSQTRASWLALLVMSCILLLFSKKTSFFIIAIFFAVIFSAEAFTKHDLLKRFLSIQEIENNQSNVARLEFWKANIKLSADHPWLGVGYAASRTPSVIDPYLHRFTEDEDVLYQHPHNEYLDHLSGMGAPALVLFVSILFWPLLIALNLLRRAPPNTPMLWLSFCKNKCSRQQSDYALTERQYYLAVLAFCYLIFMLIAAFFDKLTLVSWSTIIFCWALIFYLHDQLHQIEVTGKIPS